MTTITKLGLNGNQAVVERDVEGDTEVIEVALPALFTAQQEGIGAMGAAIIALVRRKLNFIKLIIFLRL